MRIANLADLEVIGDDLAFGPDGEPRVLAGPTVVAQDLRHRLREGGLPYRLLGAASAERSRLLATIARDVERDARVKPGSTQAVEEHAGDVRIHAKTIVGDIITIGA